MKSQNRQPNSNPYALNWAFVKRFKLPEFKKHINYLDPYNVNLTSIPQENPENPASPSPNLQQPATTTRAPLIRTGVRAILQSDNDITITMGIIVFITFIVVIICIAALLFNYISSDYFVLF